MGCKQAEVLQQNSCLDQENGWGVDDLNNIEPLPNNQSTIRITMNKKLYIEYSDVIMHWEVPLVHTCSFSDTHSSTNEQCNQKELIDSVRRLARDLFAFDVAHER